MINLKGEGKPVENKESRKMSILNSSFLGKNPQFSKKLYLLCVFLIQLIQAAEKEGTKAKSSFLFYKLNAGKESVHIKT